jgi:hypothetical protein
MNGQNNSGPVMLGFKFAESGPSRGMRHYAPIFDFIYGLSANVNKPAQQRL